MVSWEKSLSAVRGDLRDVPIKHAESFSDMGDDFLDGFHSYIIGADSTDTHVFLAGVFDETLKEMW
jgi:hypothetical protein